MTIVHMSQLTNAELNHEIVKATALKRELIKERKHRASKALISGKGGSE